MTSVQRSVTVDQPVEKVWAYLSDFRSSQEWDPPSVRTDRISGDAGSVQLLDTITLESRGSGTTVTYLAEFTPQGAARLAEPLLPAALKVLADRVAESLEEHLRDLS